MTLPAPVVPSVPSAMALRLRVTGVVQGVGFRPFVHRLALREEIRGWVRNTAGAPIRKRAKADGSIWSRSRPKATSYSPSASAIWAVRREMPAATRLFRA